LKNNKNALSLSRGPASKAAVDDVEEKKTDSEYKPPNNFRALTVNPTLQDL